jgi:aerobic carbon-monoxide dehydrogenase medium subunit
MRKFDFYKPQSLQELWELKSKIPNSRFIAGGSDVMVKLRKGISSPQALISLRSIPELKNISVGDHIRIGAATSISELTENADLKRLVPVLVQAAGRIGGTQIRNVATVGGNIGNCSPCADTAPALLVLEASAVVQSANERRIVPIHEFFKGPGQSCLTSYEICAELQIDIPCPQAKAIFMKKGRVQLDLALASVAVLLEMDGKICRKARIAAGSVAPTPLRLFEAEKVLENNEITEEIIREAQRLAMEGVSPISDVRCSADYRRKIVGAYVKKAIHTLMNGGQDEKRN